MKRTKARQRAEDDLPGRIIERPDGFYWERDGHEYGPFATLAEAEADMESGGEGEFDYEYEPEPESLHEAEAELGISDWIDPDTGAPAEESVPRIEDH
jgi:hypothetical protein